MEGEGRKASNVLSNEVDCKEWIISLFYNKEHLNP